MIHGQDPLAKKASELLQHRLCAGLVPVVIVVVIVVICPQPAALVEGAAKSTGVGEGEAKERCRNREANLAADVFEERLVGVADDGVR